MMKERTRIEMYTLIAETLETVEHIEKEEMIKFVEHQIQLLADKKARSGGKSEKKKAETMALAEQMLEIMVGKGAMTATQIYKECEKAGLEEITSSQKVVSLLKTLGDKVVKTTEKKTSYFSVA